MLVLFYTVCSHRIFLLKQLREPGIPLKQLHTVFQASISQPPNLCHPSVGSIF